jgi:hypothetical protein
MQRDVAYYDSIFLGGEFKPILITLIKTHPCFDINATA